MSTSPPLGPPSVGHRPKSRGQLEFVRMPPFAAMLYDRIMADTPLQQHYAEIAEELAGRITQGQLLDVGTGPGRLLMALYALCPRVRLHGLDISPAMLAQAQRNLAGLPVALQLGDIRQAAYPDDCFDLVVSTGSFYVWDAPQAGLDEIYRILVRGGAAYLFESRRDLDEDAFRRALRAKLREASLLTKLAGPLALHQALARSYTRAELAALIATTRFADSHDITDVTLAGLPIWQRVELRKPA